MAAATSEDLLSIFDRCPLHRRYWTAFSLLSLVGVADFFDFFSVGFLVAVLGPRWHLVAIIDWATRRVLSWRLSNTLTAGFCVEALSEALGPVRQSRHLQYRSGRAIHQRRVHPDAAGSRDRRSAWMDAGAATTTSLSSACGAHCAGERA
jgi:hypothetical protein